MLPAEYATPAAIVITLGGLLACFAGFRLFRLVLGVYGFVAGALVAPSLFAGTSSAWGQIVAAVVGGLVGGVLMIAAYFIGVGLVGAGLAALLLNLAWRFVGGVPPTWLLVIVAVIGALCALSISRYVVIIGTATAGAWTFLIGALALTGDRSAMAATTAGNVWVFHPLDPMPARWWYTLAWIALLVVGVVVQLATTSKTGKAKTRKRPKAQAAA